MESCPVQLCDLTSEDIVTAQEIINQDSSHLASHIQQKFETQAHKMWEVFYRNNGNRFFKDRHYILREFPEIREIGILQEVGCGVGNAIIPLLRDCPNLTAQVSDFSPKAIEILNKAEELDHSRISSAVCDIAKTPTPFQEQCDGVLIMFVLSAISPEKHRQAILNATHNLKPGGMVFFRDYALYDHSQIRFATKQKNKLSRNFYLKQDGTRVYFFSNEDIRAVFEGFEEVELKTQVKLYQNRKEQLNMKRILLDGKFRKV